MEILNVSPWEVVLILLIALIVLGPGNMVKSARSAGRMIYRIAKSPLWATLLSRSKTLRELPARFVREAGLDESFNELDEQSRKTVREFNHVLRDEEMNEEAEERRIQPPRAEPYNPGMPVPDPYGIVIPPEVRQKAREGEVRPAESLEKDNSAAAQDGVSSHIEEEVRNEIFLDPPDPEATLPADKS